MIKRKYILVILALCSLILGCSSPFRYNFDIVNYGKFGVTFIKFPGLNLRNRVSPGIPGVRDDVHFKGSAFFDNHDVLPKEPIEIVWQLNELTDCKVIRGPYESYDKEYPGMFTYKGLCKWTPIPDKVFSKTIDIQALKKSEHFKRSGKNADGFSLIPRFARKRIMEIHLVFRDNEMDVNVDSFITNPFK